MFSAGALERWRHKNSICVIKLVKYHLLLFWYLIIWLAEQKYCKPKSNNQLFTLFIYRHFYSTHRHSNQEPFFLLVQRKSCNSETRSFDVRALVTPATNTQVGAQRTRTDLNERQGDRETQKGKWKKGRNEKQAIKRQRAKGSLMKIPNVLGPTGCDLPLTLPCDSMWLVHGAQFN